MATILEFPRHQRLSAVDRRGVMPAAEIVFFPGVRYERWETHPAAKAKKRQPRRDKIELEG